MNIKFKKEGSMNNITLIGMPASGKSTVGVVLAKTLGKSFLDVDLMIQERENALLQDIVDKLGQKEFVLLEEKNILSIEVENAVIAPGGSAVYSEKAMAHLKAIGKLVYIKLPFNIIEERLNNINSRGIAMEKGETLLELYQKRVPLYEKYCDFYVEGEGLSIEEVVESIVLKIQ